MTERLIGELEIDSDRGVIYFHTGGQMPVTVLRICSLPTPIPKIRGAQVMLDITHMTGVSWASQPVTPCLSTRGRETRIADAFRQLRDAWFAKTLRDEPHEREWEEADAEATREAGNKEEKQQFDAQTERIIAGEDLPICPRCQADMDVG